MCVDDQMLSAYLDGELEEPWKTQVSQHLAYCAACRTRYEHLRSLDAALKDDVPAHEDEAHRQERVLAYFEKTRFATHRKPAGFLRRRVQVTLVPALLSSAAAFVVVFVGAFSLGEQNGVPAGRELPSAVHPLDASAVRQVSYEVPEGLGAYSVGEIVRYLNDQGYDVTLSEKRIDPVTPRP